MELHVHGETETGRVRDHNEDSILNLGGERSPPGVDALLVVADGMGGHAAGEVASKLTVEHIEQHLIHRFLVYIQIQLNMTGQGQI